MSTILKVCGDGFYGYLKLSCGHYPTLSNNGHSSYAYGETPFQIGQEIECPDCRNGLPQNVPDVIDDFLKMKVGASENGHKSKVD